MARRVIEKNLTTRDSRKKLPTRAEPHWRLLGSGLHLGYRKMPKGGTWVGRRFTEDRRYKETRLGLADDAQNADGNSVLTFDQAHKAARIWFEEERRKELDDEVYDGEYTVAVALEDYMAHYRVEGKSAYSVQTTINAHIVPSLGNIRVDRLTTKKINDWLQKLAANPARLRTSKTAEKRNTREQKEDADAIRRRRATANRVLNVLKAALNYAWREGRVQSDNAWRKVSPFKNVAAPLIRYLTAKECVRLINACPADLRALVQGALLTGCRYGELARLKVSDFNDDAGTVSVRRSKSGKARHVVLTEEGKTFFEAVTIGKGRDALIFVHDDGTAWGKSHQSRPLKEACAGAKITPAIGFHILRHTHGSLLAMQSVPIPVIAKQLGHADTRMTEKHYAHLSPSYIADTIRQNFPKLGVVQDMNIVPLRQKKGKVNP